MPYRYTVTATFSDASIANEWLDWLKDGHCRDVLNAGAERVEIVQLDGSNDRYDVRYDFPDRNTFELYEKHHAPRLRQDGLERFPPECGIAYSRTTGTVLFGED